MLVVLVADRDDVVVGGEHVLGEPAVGAEPDELAVAAELFVALVALAADAVTPVRVDHHEVALRRSPRTWARRHPARRWCPPPRGRG